jgi:hypothetical protein
LVAAASGAEAEAEAGAGAGTEAGAEAAEEICGAGAWAGAATSGAAPVGSEGFSSMTGCTPLTASQCARRDGSRGQGGRGASSTSSSDSTARELSLLLPLPCALATTCASDALLLQNPYLRAQRDKHNQEAAAKRKQRGVTRGRR